MGQIIKNDLRTLIKAEIEEEEYQEQPVTHVTPSRPRLKVSSPPSVSLGLRDVSIDPKAIPQIKLGQTFSSFAEVSNAVRIYQLCHKVNLTQKYFRRIAAYPKPTNKEDYSLSEEERKRFVYRWVDFCCKYFEEEAAGYSMKECPMRIRFQLRFKEKDLVISIFRETHDHDIPEGESPQPIPTLPQTDTPHTSSIATTLTSIADHQSKKTVRPVPPLTLSTSLASGVRSLQGGHGQQIINTKQFLQNQLPRPPPLKKGGVGTSTSMTTSESLETYRTFDQGRAKRPQSVESVVRNVYQYLCRLHSAGANSQTDLFFGTPNPDIIKITSDMSGVDVGTVIAACGSKRVRQINNKSTSSINETRPLVYSPPNTNGHPPHIARILRGAKQKRKPSSIEPTLHTRPRQVEFSNNTVHQVPERKFVDMPLEVIIKTDPDTIEYFEGGMDEDEEYYGTECDESRR